MGRGNKEFKELRSNRDLKMCFARLIREGNLIDIRHKNLSHTRHDR